MTGRESNHTKSSDSTVSKKLPLRITQDENRLTINLAVPSEEKKNIRTLEEAQRLLAKRRAQIKKREEEERKPLISTDLKKLEKKKTHSNENLINIIKENIEPYNSLPADIFLGPVMRFGDYRPNYLTNRNEKPVKPTESKKKNKITNGTSNLKEIISDAGDDWLHLFMPAIHLAKIDQPERNRTNRLIDTFRLVSKSYRSRKSVSVEPEKPRRQPTISSATTINSDTGGQPRASFADIIKILKSSSSSASGSNSEHSHLKLDALKNEIDKTMKEISSFKNEVNTRIQNQTLNTTYEEDIMRILNSEQERLNARTKSATIDTAVNTDISMSNAVFTIKYEDEDEDEDEEGIEERPKTNSSSSSTCLKADDAPIIETPSDTLTRNTQNLPKRNDYGVPALTLLERVSPSNTITETTEDTNHTGKDQIIDDENPEDVFTRIFTRPNERPEPVSFVKLKSQKQVVNNSASSFDSNTQLPHSSKDTRENFKQKMEAESSDGLSLVSNYGRKEMRQQYQNQQQETRKQQLTRNPVFDFSKKRPGFSEATQRGEFDSSSSQNFTSSRGDYFPQDMSHVRLKIMPLKRSCTLDSTLMKPATHGRCFESMCSSRSSCRHLNQRFTPVNCTSCTCTLSCHSVQPNESILINIKDRRYINQQPYRSQQRPEPRYGFKERNEIKKTSLDRNIMSKKLYNELSILKRLDEELAREECSKVEAEEELLSNEIRFTLNTLRRPHSSFQIDNFNDEDFSSKSYSLAKSRTRNFLPVQQNFYPYKESHAFIENNKQFNSHKSGSSSVKKEIRVDSSQKRARYQKLYETHKYFIHYPVSSYSNLASSASNLSGNDSGSDTAHEHTVQNTNHGSDETIVLLNAFRIPDVKLH